MKVLNTLCLLICLLFLSGCATLFSESTYKIYVKSHAKADRYKVVDLNLDRVIQDCKIMDRHIELKASQATFEKGYYKVILYKNNREFESHELTAGFDGHALWNILFFPGFFVDGASGAYYKLPDSI
jgi:hypothetical protein